MDVRLRTFGHRGRIRDQKWERRSGADAVGENVGDQMRPGSILGTEVRRVEDPEILHGTASYVGDLDIEGVLELAFVRSPHAHALIAGTETSAAAAMPGVVAVLTAADLDVAPFNPAFGARLYEGILRPPLSCVRHLQPEWCVSWAKPSWR
jgi:hypothetical protein